MSDPREVDRGRLDIFEALLAAIERRDEVSVVIEVSADDEVATRGLQDLLGIGEAPAIEVMNMQWRRLTRDGRTRLLHERDALRHRLADRA